jgi:uncharacterized membrane protein
MNQGWHLAFIGVSWYLMLPLAVLAAWGCLHLYRFETLAVPPTARRILMTLRLGSLAGLALLLVEPTITHVRLEAEVPRLAVVMDTSGSMAVQDAQMSATHRLDEAVALGLVDPSERPDPWRRGEQEVRLLGSDLDRLLASELGEDSATQDRQRRILCSKHLDAIQGLAKELGGTPEFAEHFHLQQALLQRLSLPRTSASRAGDAGLASDVGAFKERLQAIEVKLMGAQMASDASLLAGSANDSPLGRAIERLTHLRRLGRSQLALAHVVTPALAGRANLEVLTLDAQTPPFDPRATAHGPTDFAGPLSHLAREWHASETLSAGVLIISDGRQTAGTDPAPAARALAARDIPVYCLAVGDPDPPRDAVLAELRGPQEIFKGETVRLDARLRITGYDNTDWDLVLERDGRELERRSVRASGAWQSERFEHPDASAGLHTWRARLERPQPASTVIRAGSGLLRELWNGIPDPSFAAHEDALARPPSLVALLSQAATHDVHDEYLERWRGWVVPPVSGTYTFWICSDDSSQLSLSTGANPAQCQVIADVPDYCPPGTWDKYQSQRSLPVDLEAGKPYYLEVLHKQALGDAHCAVGWQLPDNQLERPIPGTRMAPWPSSGTPSSQLPADAPEASIDNNQADCTVAVVDDPLQVLVIDSEPRWDTRYLGTMFERDPRARIERRYRSALLTHGEHALLPATQDELDRFDVVVLGDIAADELSSEEQGRLVRFVAERGGFLMCISGPRGMPAAYGLGSMADLLPIHVPSTIGDCRQTATVSLPGDAVQSSLDSPITTLLDDPALNRRLWPALSPLQWFVPGVTPKPGADVLLLADDQLHSPLLVVQHYGAGRVLWIGSDETWRWRDRLGERVHQTFWLQALRWGLGSRLRGRDPRLQVAVDRLLIEPGGSLELMARTHTVSGLLIRQAPLARLNRIDDAGTVLPGTELRIELREEPDAAGLFHAQVQGLGEGRWRIEFSSPHPDLGALTEIREVLVRHRTDQEGLELASDPAALQRIAAAGNGRAEGMDGAAALMSEISAKLRAVQVPKRRVWRVWGGYGCLLVLVGLLTSEWLLRRRCGLP